MDNANLETVYDPKLSRREFLPRLRTVKRVDDRDDADKAAKATRRDLLFGFSGNASCLIVPPGSLASSWADRPSYVHWR